jgi:hypothetical protein
MANAIEWARTIKNPRIGSLTLSKCGRVAIVRKGGSNAWGSVRSSFFVVWERNGAFVSLETGNTRDAKLLAQDALEDGEIYGAPLPKNIANGRDRCGVWCLS